MGDNITEIIVDKAVQALKKLKSYPRLLFASALCDALFFFIFGFITAPMYRKITEYIVIIGTAISESASSMLRGQESTINSIIANNPETSAYFNSLLLVYVILAVSVYIIYAFFHSVSWRISFGIAGKKTSMYKFMKEFSLLTLFWFVIFIIYYFIDFFAELRVVALQSMNIEAPNIMGNFATLMIILIFYFSMISYTLIGKGSTWKKIKKSFVIGVKKAKYIVPCYAVIAVVYLILETILDKIAVNIYAMVIIGLLTMIPAITWARVYLISIIEKIESK